MRKFLPSLVVLAVALGTAAPAAGPKFSTSGGIGSADSTFSGGEPVGGTYSINGTTGRVSVPIVNLRPGSAPASPQNGDCWTTVAGLFCRINDVTVGPYGASSGSVTQVGLVTPSIFTAGGAVTSSGNLSFTLNSQLANQVFAGPNGSSGIPGFRALVGADVPAINMAASGNGGVTGTLGLANGGLAATTAAGGRSTLGLGTSAVQNIGTSGAKVPLLNGLNAWSADQTVDGILSSTGTTAARGVVVATNAGFVRSVRFQTNSSPRWSVGVNAGAESGGSAGSDFSINRFNDAGTFLDAPLAITRSSGVISLSQPLPLASGGLGATTAAGGRSTLGLGTAAVQNTGTSGATIPLLNGSNTWSAAQTYSGPVTVGTSVQSGDALELGQNRASDGTPFIDFHAAVGNDYEARIIRGSGVNGPLNLSNLGTGDVNITGGGFINLSSPSGVSANGPMTAPYFKPTNTGCANILHYGADKTGVAASDAAWDAALAATQPGKQCIYLPAGEYKFSSTKTASISDTYYRGSVTIKGDGSELTLLNFANNTTGVAITLNTQFQSFHVRDLAILAGGWSTSTTGLYAYQAATVSNPAISAASDIVGVVVRGNDGYSNEFGFFNGIGISGVSNVSIFGGYLSGPGNVTTKPADCLHLSGRTETNAVAINIIGATINSCGVGILYGDSAEGVTVTASNLVANGRGIYSPPGTTDGVMLTVTNSHFNNYTSSIDFQVDPGGIAISNNYFIVNTGLGNANAININATQDYAITGNIFARQRPELTANGIVIGTYSEDSGLISNNVFQSLNTAILLGAGSQRATVGINSFASTVTTKVTNSGTNNIVAATCTAAPTSGFRVTNGVITAC